MPAELLAFALSPYLILALTAPIWMPLVWLDERRRRKRDGRGA